MRAGVERGDGTVTFFDGDEFFDADAFFEAVDANPAATPIRWRREVVCENCGQSWRGWRWEQRERADGMLMEVAVHPRCCYPSYGRGGPKVLLSPVPEEAGGV